MIPQNCRKKKLGDEVTENWQNVEGMKNELDYYSNDQLYLFSVFAVRSLQLHVNKHLRCFLQMYDGTFNLWGIQDRGCISNIFFKFRSGSVDKVSLGIFLHTSYITQSMTLDIPGTRDIPGTNFKHIPEVEILVGVYTPTPHFPYYPMQQDQYSSNKLNVQIK